MKRVEESRAAFLAASRSADSRTAELALAKLGTRYPYPYEFAEALKLDPQNVPLRKELAYLYLAMHNEPEAADQFRAILTIDPKDEATRQQLDSLEGLKSRLPAVSRATPAPKVSAKEMGMKSLSLGYTRDAVKYLQQAHEQDPYDPEIMLQLGWAYNQSKADADAITWFDKARRCDDPQIAAEASKAFHNLRGDTLPQTTIWTLPMFSSRWKDVFSYGQIKRSVPLPWLGETNKLLTFYVSMRFDGDVKGELPAHVLLPQYLSQSSVTFGAGVSTKTWHHLMGWAEAGEAINYLPFRHDIGTAMPDYRGGLNYTKGFGHLLGSQTPGPFAEATVDAEYISRFDKDWLLYSQNRGRQNVSVCPWRVGPAAVQCQLRARLETRVLGEYGRNWSRHALSPALDAAEHVSLNRSAAWFLHRHFAKAKLQRCARERLVCGDEMSAGPKLMRTVLLVSLLASALGATTFQVRGTDVKPWAAILGSVGMTEDQQRDPEVMVAGPAARAEVSELAQNHFLIVEGTGPVAAQLGIHAKSPALRVRQICDTHAANTQIFWEHPVDVAPIDLPAGFQMFATEKWKNVPVLAGKRTVHGAILWLATEPGASGIERFPYLLQALADLGWTASAESTNLWAFFDSSYRIRADPEYLARHWRRAGIAVLHAAAWHNMEPDAARDEYLKQVIEACHRNAISVYAWLELPHVSEKF